MTTLVHPDMLTSLAAFYPLTCTFTLAAPGVDAHGRPNGAPGNVAGLVSLPCSMNRPSSRMAQEVLRSDLTVVTEAHEVAIAGYYPAITTEMECVIASVAYNVLSVVHDAQVASTWVLVEKVST